LFIGRILSGAICEVNVNRFHWASRRAMIVMATALGLAVSVAGQRSDPSSRRPQQQPERSPVRGDAKPRLAQPEGNKFGLANPLPRASGAIRLATYNTLNLFDRSDDPSLHGEFDDAKFPTSEDRCRGLAAAIKAVDADIIALQEVESMEALTWFRDTYLPDARYKYLASKDVGYYRGVECAVMSRFPITNVQTWPDESLDDVKREGKGWATLPKDKGIGLKFQRSPLMVDIKINDGYTLTVFSLHHKAGREFDAQREAEALQIVEYIDQMRRGDPSRNIVVMGDFNAAPWDKSLRVYLQAGMIDTLAFRTTQGDDEALLYKTHESNRVLDYILLNSAAHRELVIGSPFVLGTLYPGDQYDFTKDPHPPGYASDHYPVTIELVPDDAQR
jgi:endonuclease/exonuclease/phosphatase family metal-dependent hydrolase